PSRLQLRLPGVRTVSTDPVLQDALSRALSGRDGESRRSAWIALSAALGDRAWAREMAEERWPEERAAQLAIVAAMARVSSSPDPWSADAHTDALRDFSAHFIRWLDARADSEARESWREAWLQAVAEREEDLRRRHGAQQEPPEGPSGATSGLEDPAVWDRLRLPLPRPESRSKSAPPPPSERGLVHITSIRLREVRPLQDLELKLGRAPEGKGQWVAIIGENATGKTTILRSLVLALMDLSDESRPAPLPQEAFTTRWRRNGAGTEEECSIAVMTASGDFKITIQSQQNAESFSHQQGPEGRPLIFGYGSRRGSALGGAAREVAYVPGDEIATLFTEGASLIHAETWLALRHAAKLTRPDGPEGLLFTAVLDALRELLPGVDKIEVRGMRVWVSGPAVGEVPLAALSDGYLATTGWVLDLIARWIDRAERRGEEVQPGFTQTMSGLVLIDEIDLYLHPRWQRSLIQDVRRVFPRMSFVITTHNPFTLLGAEPEEIWVLRRTEDRGVVAERGQESPALMSGSQIYSAYFGITSLFPDELGEKLRRYGFLAGSPVRTDEEEVEVHALLAELREHDVDPGWDIVPRESPPDFSEGEETGA
ncbi:MAG TPA: AAA family ATPase, partial [Candidatus Nanopelagicales bacterium]|nr:AAA family ATPase [Candidatus Nanopelagicales bacterium]